MLKKKFCAALPAVLAAALLAGCALLSDSVPTEETVLNLFTEPPIMSSLPADTEAPRILEIRGLTVYEGDTIAYRNTVTVTDDRDQEPQVTVDSSKVDLTTAGTYEVIYTATDVTGNSVSATATVTVLPKEVGFVDMQTITSTAEVVLDTIVWDNATTEEAIRAIYNWTRSHISYSGHSDRTDWRQTAYTVLTECKGDCFGFFAVTKLFFEQLQIPNIDVQKVRNSSNDSDHFWSLVSIDGGESFYHFDATPRWGEGDDFCLVTDDFLDDYSADHKNSHNRDTSLYPTTPEEAP